MRGASGKTKEAKHKLSGHSAHTPHACVLTHIPAAIMLLPLLRLLSLEVSIFSFAALPLPSCHLSDFILHFGKLPSCVLRNGKLLRRHVCSSRQASAQYHIFCAFNDVLTVNVDRSRQAATDF